MSPRTKEQVEQIRESSRHKIMEVAFELFAENGYHNTSVAQIAKAANISKGLIYNYFDSKEQLLMELVMGIFHKMADQFPYTQDANIAPEDKLSRYIRDAIVMIEQDSQYWRLIYALLLQSGVAKKVKPMIEAFEKEFFPMLTKMFADMGMPNPEETTLLFHTQLDGLALMYTMEEVHIDSERIIKQLEYLYIPEHLRKK